MWQTGVFISLIGLLPGQFSPAKHGIDSTSTVFANPAGQQIIASKKNVPSRFPAIEVRQVATGLNNPTAVSNAGDGSDRLFVAQQTGEIRIVINGALLVTPFLDISDLVGDPESGLLGLILHPDYAENGFFYVDYIDDEGDTVVARYTVSESDPNVADPNSAFIILTQEQPTTNHNGGHLAFGPDGYLYVAFGDGGCCGDPNGYAQNLETWLGKLLRVDVNRDDFPADPNRNYGIPADNPFVGRNGLDEIWAYGFRNPWRCTFDRDTGDLFIGDVGELSWEEINFQPAGSTGGENYGWNILEAMHCFHDEPPGSCDDFLNGGSTLPVLEYSHSIGCSVTGGYRYRGERYPDLEGIYFYGDFCTGAIWGARPQDNGTWQSEELLVTGFTITSFGEDEAGELYVVDYDGDHSALYQIVSRRTGPRSRPTPVPRPTQ